MAGVTASGRHRPIRLGFVVQRYGAEVNGGAELQARTLAERLVARNDVASVTVVTTCAKRADTWADDYPPGASTVGGVWVERFPVAFPRLRRLQSALGTWVRRAPYPDFADRLWLLAQGPVSPGLIRRLPSLGREVDAVAFFTYLYHPTVAGLPRLAGQALLVPEAHDEPAIHQRLFRGLFRLPRAVAFNAPEERDFVLSRFDLGEARHDVVGCGVELGEGKGAGLTHAPVPGPFLLYLGRVDEKKGVFEAADAFAALRARNAGAHLDPGGGLPPLRIEDLTLVVAGGGDPRDLAARPGVVPLGFVDDGTRLALLRGCLALVMPSRFESLSLVTLEAMTLGKPVLVQAACAVTRGHVERSGGGALYATGDEFIRALLPLAASAELRASAGERGRAYVERNYAWPVVEARFLALARHAAGFADAVSSR